MRDILRRIMNMFRSGTVEKCEQKKANIKFGENLEVPEALRLESYGLSTRPPNGSQGLAFFPGGEGFDPAVLFVVAKKEPPKLNQPGDVVLWSTHGPFIAIKKNGMTLKSNSGFSIKKNDQDLIEQVAKTLEVIADDVKTTLLTGIATPSGGPVTFQPVFSNTEDMIKQIREFKCKT